MRVLFLCYGNKCRSPLAEGLLKHILKLNNIEAEVDSAGFEAFNINDYPEDRAINAARKNGIDISSNRVRLFSQYDFDHFDKIYVMDTLSYNNAMDFARNDEDRAKVEYLLNLLKPGRNESVPNPIYQQKDAIDETFDLLHLACKKIADEVISQPLN